MLLDDASGALHLIDWEHAGVNAVAFELGNFFCQLMAAPAFDPESYPPLSVRAAFVDDYLRARADVARDEAAVTGGAAALLAAADAYSLASHVQWAAWCAVQAALSRGIEYDFAVCARNLLACHDERRHEALRPCLLRTSSPDSV